MTCDAASPRMPAGARLRPVLNRWLSPDHAMGRTLMRLRMRLQLAGWRPAHRDDAQLKAAIARLAPAFTMVDLQRLRTLAGLAARVAGDGVRGSIVECGTWRGGGLALVDWVLRQHGEQRELWGFDSFAGLPAPGPRDGARVRAAFFNGWCAAEEADVRRALQAVNGDPAHLHLVRGVLAETLPVTDTGPIALLNLDVDWYDSVKGALDTLFDRLVPGGYLNIDDYRRWPGCDAAVHDFMRERALPLPALQCHGPQGAWLQKR
jgi:O-methyltransferase